VPIDLERLPQSAEQLSAAWLSDALRAGGVLPAAARVASVDARPLGAGGGLIGVVAKAHVGYSGDPGDAPRTLIAKFPSQVAANRAVADTYDMYGREVRFYQELSPTTRLPHPRCYFAARSARSSDFVLLLEDLGDRRIGDQVAGSDLVDAQIVIDCQSTIANGGWLGFAAKNMFSRRKSACAITCGPLHRRVRMSRVLGPTLPPQLRTRSGMMSASSFSKRGQPKANPASMPEI